MRICLTLIFLINGYSISYAGYQRLFLGFGAVYCKEIFFNKDSWNGSLYFPWAQGYLSGMNAILRLSSKKSVDFSVISVEEEQAFIKDYCQKNPDSTYGFAVEELYQRIIKLQE